MNDRWAKKRMLFRFRLGETTLFAPELDVAVHRGRFLDENEKTETFVLPSGERDVRVFVALSHPIEGHIEPVKILPEALRLATHQYRRSFIRVEGTFENYLTKLPSSRRNQIKRKVKKLKEHSGGTLDFRVYRTPEEILGFHALAREVSKKTYQERMLGKGLPVHREFMEAMQARAKDGRAIGFLLFLDGVAQAYLYAEIEGEFMAYDFVGFDPVAGDLSPGNVLQISILEWVFREKPCRYFDFGEGQSQYKEFFATEHVPCADLYFFPRNASGYALFGAQAGLHYLSRGIVSGLERAGVKEKVKVFFRRGWIASLLGRTKERAPVEGDPSGDPPA